MAKMSATDALQFRYGTRDPYRRDNRKWWNYLFYPSFTSSAGSAIANDNFYDQSKALRTSLASKLQGDELKYWNSLSAPEQDALLDLYYTEYDNGLYNLWGLQGTSEKFDLDTFLKDIGEYSNIEVAPTLSEYVNVDDALATAQASVDAENERLLALLNEDLQRTGDAYKQAKDTLLTGQYRRNMQTMDTLSSDMARSRRNAIEAGASAGIRIAENVNTLLTAQNKMSQQSLDTSNQLAQMLINQRSAEAGLRNQWRDVQSSTYDKIQGRAQNEMNLGRQRYDAAQEDWQNRYGSAVSPSNALSDSMLNYKTRQKSAYSTNAKSAY